MALENIKQMTRSLSSKGDEKKVAQYAPEDYLKRAVEQFIIEFPEFEDLPSEELYKEMEKKGYFSDQYASSDYGIPITPGYMRDALLGGYGDHIHGLSDDELRNMDDDMIKEIYDDINDMFKYGKIGELKKEVQVAMSDPDPMAERMDMMDILAEKHFGKSYDKLTPKEIELLEENWDELISQRKQPRDIRRVNQGGIIGLRFGGDPRTEQRSQGITQLASHSGDDVIQSAILWAAGLPQFGSIDAVVKSLEDGSTDMNGLVNAYMDAVGDSN